MEHLWLDSSGSSRRCATSGFDSPSKPYGGCGLRGAPQTGGCARLRHPHAHRADPRQSLPFLKVDVAYHRRRPVPPAPRARAPQAIPELRRHRPLDQPARARWEKVRGGKPLAAPASVSDPLTDLLRAGARRLIEAAVSAEFGEYLSAFEEEKLPDGRRRMVRNGHLPERQILTGIGAVDVRVPKARSRSGSAEPFRSALVPPYVRRSASVDAAVPWLYLHGVSTGQ